MKRLNRYDLEDEEEYNDSEDFNGCKYLPNKSKYRKSAKRKTNKRWC